LLKILDDRISFRAFKNDELFACLTETHRSLLGNTQVVNSEVIFTASVVDKVTPNAPENFVTMMFALDPVSALLVLLITFLVT